tara:strand:+ start:2869 stop:3753 length:885 start_codon:yes stop_codon:yes gene_type:complete
MSIAIPSSRNYPLYDHNNRIVSLWDMLQLEAKTFVSSITLIASCVGDLNVCLNLMDEQPGIRITHPIQKKALILHAVRTLTEAAARHGLAASHSQAMRCNTICVDILTVPGPYTAGSLRTLVTALTTVVNVTVDEAESRKFFAVDQQFETYHQSADILFGVAVVDVFPEAELDIEEAGKCLSFNLWTATVMHTMRVLETGLSRLATHVGVAHGDNWNKTLGDIETALRAVQRKSDGAEAEQWAAEAGTHLRFIKNAWRNHAMHAHVTYDEARARAIFDNARSFMQHLADRLIES